VADPVLIPMLASKQSAGSPTATVSWGNCEGMGDHPLNVRRYCPKPRTKSDARPRVGKERTKGENDRASRISCSHHRGLVQLARCACPARSRGTWHRHDTAQRTMRTHRVLPGIESDGGRPQRDDLCSYEVMALYDPIRPSRHSAGNRGPLGRGPHLWRDNAAPAKSKRHKTRATALGPKRTWPTNSAAICIGVLVNSRAPPLTSQNASCNV